MDRTEYAHQLMAIFDVRTVAEEMGISAQTVVRLVEGKGIGGKKPGAGSRLTNDQLLTLHRLHTRGIPVAELARQITRVYPNPKSGEEAIRRGWRRLELPVLRGPGMRRCRATVKPRSSRQSPRRCERVSLVGSKYCLMHDPSQRERVAEHAKIMRLELARKDQVGLESAA